MAEVSDIPIVHDCSQMWPENTILHIKNKQTNKKTYAALQLSKC